MPDSLQKPIKCVVWDLDDTLWNGVLLEGRVAPREDAAAAVRELDERGILQSVASKNDHFSCIDHLRALDFAEYFLCPQINWQPKSQSLRRIAEGLNISLDSFAFVDDQPFERAEVEFTYPEVLCIDADQDLRRILEHPRTNPQFRTRERSQRRIMYRQDFERRAEEQSFAGSNEEFLASLDMKLKISPAKVEDLARVEELIERTSQLNSTGYVYSFDELATFSGSSDHTLLVAELWDKFGWYGKIGLALIERHDSYWVLKLLIVSCRVMTRGIGTTLLSEVMRAARGAGRTLRAEFTPTERNRIMMVTYRFAGFREMEREDRRVILAHDLKTLPETPKHLALIDDWQHA